MNLPKSLTAALDDLLTRAFAEEGEDVTSLAVFGPAARVAAKMVCRERAVVSGAAFLPRLFAFLSPPARVTLRVADGDAVGPVRSSPRSRDPRSPCSQPSARP